MTVRLPSLCAVILAAQISPALSADAEGRYAANYPATLSCSKIAAAQPASQELYAVAAFTEGWFAAHAKLTPGVFDFTPWQSVEYLVGQVRAYCAAKPDDNLMAALNALTIFLTPDALTVAEQPKAVSNGDQVIFVYPSVLVRILDSLRAKGFAAADATDPVAGLADFQRGEGLAASGLPDQQTLQRLFAD